MKYSVKNYPDIMARVEKMDVESLLLAVICPDINADGALSYHPTSVFIHPTTSELAHSAACRINSEALYPALIVSDMEFGAGNMIKGATRFPSMRAAKESADSALAYKMGEIAAKEARNTGYHWTFAPCVDILFNSYNPVVHYRTAGDCASDVIEYCGAYMRGLQDNGIVATLKHFPGDGCSPDDQHVTTTVNPLSKEEWDDSFGEVYSQLIEQGAMTIMPGHIALPAYDEPDENGIYPPATVSKRLLTDLLRKKLGFEGIIVSDAVSMNGFCGYMNLYHASCAFLEAGGDCLLFMRGSDEYLYEMKKCIAEGRLSLTTLKDRAYRMLCFSRQYFETFPSDMPCELDAAWADSVAREMTYKAVKVSRDRRGLLPVDLGKDSSVAHVVLFNPWVRDTSASDELTEKLRAVAGRVEEIRDPGPDKLLEIAKSGEFDLIVCSVCEAPAWGLNTAKLCGPSSRNMMSGWMRYGTPAVFVAYDSTCFGEIYSPSVDTLIETHGVAKHTVDAVLELLVK